MMVTWNDIKSSFSEIEQKLVANLCLMVDSNKEEVFDSKSVLDFHIIKSQNKAFDNPLSDSHILTQKCAYVKQQLSNAHKENEKLRIDNEMLLKKKTIVCMNIISIFLDN